MLSKTAGLPKWHSESGSHPIPLERKENEMKRIVQMASVVAALLLGVGTAWAIPPDQGEDEIPVGAFFLSDCGGEIDICEGGDLFIRWKLFFFNNGDPRLYREKVSFDGALFECGNPDNYLPYNPLHYTFSVDQITGDSIIHGLWAMVTLPGHGQIYRDVGTIVVDLNGDITFEAGEHEAWNEEFDVVCDFLAND
jgi:hypothetical protein